MATQKYNTDVVLTIDLDKAKQDLAALTKQIQDLNASSDTNEKEVKALEKQWDLLNSAIKKAEGSEKGLNSTIKDNNKALDDQTAATKKTEGAFSKSVSAFKAAGGGIKGVTAAAKAFIATPIGAAITALVAALGVLKKALSGSEGGQRALAKATAVVKGAFDSLLQVVRDTGGLLYDFFTRDWSKLGEDLDAVKAAVKGIGTNAAQNAEIAEKEFELKKKESELTVEIAKNEAEIAKQRRIAVDTSKTEAERQAAVNKMTSLQTETIDAQIKLEKDRLALLQWKHSLTDSTEEDLEEERETQAKIYQLEAEKQTVLTKTDKIEKSIEKSTKNTADNVNKTLEAEKERQGLLSQLSTLENEMTNQFLDETEKRIQAAYDEEAARKDVIDKLFEAGIIDEDRKTELLAQAALNRQTILNQIEEEGRQKKKEADQKAREEELAAERAALEEKKQMQQEALDAAVNVLNAIATATAEGGKKAFEVQKGAQIASAMVTGLSGAAGAYAQAAGTIPPPAGPIIGAANAAAVIATTAARIASIKQQKYNAPSESSGSTDTSSASTSAAAESGTSSVSRAIITRNISPDVTREMPKTQAVLVVDSVTSKQMQAEQINRVSTI